MHPIGTVLSVVAPCREQGWAGAVSDVSPVCCIADVLQPFPRSQMPCTGQGRLLHLGPYGFIHTASSIRLHRVRDIAASGMPSCHAVAAVAAVALRPPSRLYTKTFAFTSTLIQPSASHPDSVLDGSSHSLPIVAQSVQLPNPPLLLFPRAVQLHHPHSPHLNVLHRLDPFLLLRPASRLVSTSSATRERAPPTCQT